MVNHRKLRKSLIVVAAIILVTGVMVLNSSRIAFGRQEERTPSATIPVKTQVWLDLTATARAWTPTPSDTPTPAPTVDYTATYEFEFQNAIMTVTAQSQNGTPASPPSPAEAPSGLDALKTEMEIIYGGTFMMGTTLEEATQAMDECALYGRTCDDLAWVADSLPEHPTTVDTFYMETYEVSVAQYVAFLNWLGPDSHLTQCQGQPCALTTTEAATSTIAFDGETYSVLNRDFYSDHPATFVTWWGAFEYCAALDRRLPTEAEWERAARGSQGFIYPWGYVLDFDRLYLLANSALPESVGTEPITGYPAGASPYGVYNLAGNVSEWTSDWYDPNYYAAQLNNPQANPRGPISGTEKVLRGGAWDTIPLFLRAVHRMTAAPHLATSATGFRCVSDEPGPSLTLPEPSPTPTPAPQ